MLDEVQNESWVTAKAEVDIDIVGLADIRRFFKATQGDKKPQNLLKKCSWWSDGYSKLNHDLYKRAAIQTSQ